MANVPIAGFVPSFRNVADSPGVDYWLKAYKAGGTTPLSMAVDKDSSPSLAKCKLNSYGEPISNSSDKTTTFIPFFAEPYKLALYFSEADADANNNNRKWITGDIPLNFGSNSESVGNSSEIISGGNTKTAIESAAQFPWVNDTGDANRDLVKADIAKITNFTDDSAKTFDIVNANIVDSAGNPIPNAEIWLRNALANTTNLTLQAGAGATLESGWSDLTILPGKLAGIKRQGTTSTYSPLGCWSAAP